MSILNVNEEKKEMEESQQQQDNPCIYNIPFSDHTEPQNEAINQFRTLLTKDENDITSHNDICRFLAAREWNAENAAKMRKCDLEMRRNYQIERYHINNDYKRPRPKSVVALRKLLLTGVSDGCIGQDKAGNPVCYSHFGTYINLPLYKYITVDEYMSWHIANFEALIHNQMNTGNSAQFLMVMDLDQLGLESRHNSAFIRACSKFNEAHYPEYFYKVLCINAPKMISMLYSLVKPMLPERTKNKVCFYDRNSSAEILQQFIDKEYLPERYGGDINDDDCWSKVHENPEKILEELRLDIDSNHDKVIPLTLKAGENKIISFDVEQDSIIKWWFIVKSYDIGFSIKWRGSKKETQTTDDGDNWDVIREEQKCGNEGYGTKRFPVQGEYKCVDPEGGTIQFEFSNTHSSFKSKTVNYEINIESH